MIAEIITIGLEITTGSILNTNGRYIASKLFEMGIDVHYHTSVDDDEDRLENIINIALDRADLIITTGGLGPTTDDRTKEVVAKSLGLKLTNDKNMEKNIKKIFDNQNRHMPLNNLKQASLPEGSKFLNNSIGTAPGIFIKHKGKKIFMLPGPTREMKTMFENEMLPFLQEGFNIVNKSINLIGIGESELESQIKDLIDLNPNLTIATFVRNSGIEIRIIGKERSSGDLESKVQGIIDILGKRFDKYIYGYDNISIEEHIFEILKEKNYKVGFCESCTGGLISSRFSRVPGVSQVFDRAIVTYSNNSKIEEVGVSKNTLEVYGAVSSQTAKEMAKGLLVKSDLDLTLSVTGIAGPSGGSEDKPVGTVYICVHTKDKSIVKRHNFTGNRADIQRRSATRAFSEMRNFLLEYD